MTVRSEAFRLPHHYSSLPVFSRLHLHAIMIFLRCIFRFIFFFSAQDAPLASWEGVGHMPYSLSSSEISFPLKEYGCDIYIFQSSGSIICAQSQATITFLPVLEAGVNGLASFRRH